ncbi:MAG: hypothetical protein ACXWWQ_00230 [Candidatus Limnocylindria bacterium]
MQRRHAAAMVLHIVLTLRAFGAPLEGLAAEVAVERRQRVLKP